MRMESLRAALIVFDAVSRLACAWLRRERCRKRGVAWFRRELCRDRGVAQPASNRGHETGMRPDRVQFRTCQIQRSPRVVAGDHALQLGQGAV